MLVGDISLSFANELVKRHPDRRLIGLDPCIYHLCQLQFIQALNHGLVNTCRDHIAHDAVVVQHRHWRAVASVQDG